jgi:hypothetical protein
VILPSKHLHQSRALIGVGAEILAHLDEPRSVSELWERVRTARGRDEDKSPLSFDWFVLALTFLHAIFAVRFDGGVITTMSEQA